MFKLTTLSATLLSFLLFTLAACGSDDNSVRTQNDGRWMISDMGAQADMSATPQDMSSIVEDMSQPEDMGRGDQGATLDMAPEDMTPPQADMAPSDPFVRALTSSPWLGIFELESQGSQSVGIAIELEFGDDQSVTFKTNTARTGKWQRLNNGRLFIYELPKDDGSGDDELFFDVVEEGGQVRALSLLLSADPVRTMPFEQISARSARDFTVSELTGRWQSLQTHTNPNNNTFHLALRVDAAAQLEYGIFGPDEIFRGIFSYPIQTATFSDKRSFWYITPPTSDPTFMPVAGQLLRAVDGSVRLFAPVSEKDSRGEDVFFTYELTKVTQFSWR